MGHEGYEAPDDRAVRAVLYWLTRDGYQAARFRLQAALNTALPLERLKISSVLANSQIRTFMSAIADDTTDQLVEQSSAPDVARMAGISITMVHRRRHRARQRRSVQSGKASRKSDEG